MTYKFKRDNWAFFQNFDSLEDAEAFASTLSISVEVEEASEDEQIKVYLNPADLL